VIPDPQISAALASYGFASTPETNDKIRTYIRLLLRWNRSVSLTTVTEVDQILSFHFGESLFARTILPLENSRLADVGSGAGFPGLPLALAAPDLKVTLIESNAKKFAFLNEIIREVHLKNALALRCRMDEIAGPERHFDFITSRAFGQFADFLRWSSRQLTPTGRSLLWLGTADARSLSSEAGWTWKQPVPIPGSEGRVILSGVPRR
jgi:16S rRNA (guanine527-N7)-methyltransferase